MREKGAECKVPIKGAGPPAFQALNTCRTRGAHFAVNTASLTQIRPQGIFGTVNYWEEGQHKPLLLYRFLMHLCAFKALARRRVWKLLS